MRGHLNGIWFPHHLDILAESKEEEKDFKHEKSMRENAAKFHQKVTAIRSLGWWEMYLSFQIDGHEQIEVVIDNDATVEV